MLLVPGRDPLLGPKERDCCACPRIKNHSDDGQTSEGTPSTLYIHSGTEEAVLTFDERLGTISPAIRFTGN